MSQYFKTEQPRAPGNFPCASWSPAAVRNLPPPSRPTQSDAMPFLKLYIKSQDFFINSFQTSSTSGSKAAIWLACCTPIVGESSSTWLWRHMQILKAKDRLQKPGHYTEEMAAGTVHHPPQAESAKVVLLQTDNGRHTFIHSKINQGPKTYFYQCC